MRDIERYWEILRDIERYWEIMRDIERYWDTLRFIERYWFTILLSSDQHKIATSLNFVGSSFDCVHTIKWIVWLCKQSYELTQGRSHLSIQKCSLSLFHWGKTKSQNMAGTNIYEVI